MGRIKTKTSEAVSTNWKNFGHRIVIVGPVGGELVVSSPNYPSSSTTLTALLVVAAVALSSARPAAFWAAASKIFGKTDL